MMDLSRIVKKNGILLDDVDFIDPLLDYRYDRIPFLPESTVEDFIASNPTGIYLVTMRGHITVIRDRNII